MHNDPKETPPAQHPAQPLDAADPADADSLLPGGIGRDELLAEVRRAVEKELRTGPPQLPGRQTPSKDRNDR